MKKILAGAILAISGAGTYLYIANLEPREWRIPWQYPTNINRSNYWWDLQSTTNFINWTTEQTDVGPADPVVHIGTNHYRFYRLRGRP